MRPSYSTFKTIVKGKKLAKYVGEIYRRQDKINRLGYPTRIIIKAIDEPNIGDGNSQ